MTLLKRMTVFLLALVLATPAFSQDPPPEVPPPSDNAAVWYLTAVTMAKGFNIDGGVNNIAEYVDVAEFDLERAGPVIDRLGGVLYYIREGTKRDKCAWAVDLNLGPGVIMQHLGQMRGLTRILAVSAQVRLMRGDIAGAIEDWLTIMRMAPHAAADGTMISSLVQTSMDAVAIETLAGRLDALDREALESLKRGLTRLNERKRFWQTLASERFFLDWVRQQCVAKGVEGLQDVWPLWAEEDEMPPEIQALLDNPDRAQRTLAAWFDEMDQSYDQLLEIAKAPCAEFVVQATKFEQQATESANPLVRSLIPMLIGVAQRIEPQAQSIRAMLDAMIAYRLGGEQAFKQVADPYDGRPFDFEVTDAGVVLRSRQIQHDDQRVSLTFPAGCAKPLE